MAPVQSPKLTRLQGIYAIVNEGDDALALTLAYLRGGIKVLQYRAKSGIVPSHLLAMRELTRAHDALLILNDDWGSAVTYECDGVHLGPGDKGWEDPRNVRLYAPQLIVGLSCGTVEEVRALDMCAHYIGVGPVYATHSKADAGEPLGIEGLRKVAAATTGPVAAIGGITYDGLDQVRMSGVAMAAVISALAESENPEEAARAWVARWERGRKV